MPAINTPIRGGMTRQRLIQLADQRTRKIAHGKLNLDEEFLALLQDFCSEYYWSWRKYSTAFDTVAGQYLYNIGPTGGADVECEQIISVKYFPNVAGSPPSPPVVYATNPLSCSTYPYTRLTPLYTTDEQDVAMENTIPGQPALYFPNPGDPDSLWLSPIPDNQYHIRVTYWALPNSRYDALPDDIPLVPAFLHRILVKGLEAQIYRFALGDENAQYLAASAEYEEKKDKAAMKRDFGTGKVREYAAYTDDFGNHAIRSTS